MKRMWIEDCPTDEVDKRVVVYAIENMVGEAKGMASETSFPPE